METRARASQVQTPQDVQSSVLQRACACGNHAHGGGECEACQKKHLGLQRKQADHAEPTEVPPIVHEVLRSPGQPLDGETRAFFEPRFGHDFSRVRVHTDARAAESARVVNALAYTVGQDVVFGEGHHPSGTSAGRRLMAHELTHAVQQRGLDHVGQRLTMGYANDIYEQEASQSARLLRYRPNDNQNVMPVVQKASNPGIMRTQLFASTMEICHRMLESRVFPVSQGGIRVTANAAYERRGAPECSAASYNMTLNQKGLIYDSEYGTCEFPQGRPFSRQWTSLPNDDYYLNIWTNNTNPYCCLVGDILVEQQSGLQGESCTEPPPGPLEILHTALDLAGLIPALGAVPDAANAGIYMIEGDWTNAGLSAVAVIPIFGEAATIGKLGTRTVVRVTSEGVERVGREGIEASLREARASQRAAGQATEGAARTPRQADPDIDEMVERGIVEEGSSTTAPVRRPRPATPAVRGQAEAAREAFDRVRDDYARRLGVGSGGQVHHAIELQALDRYPGVFNASELNNFGNMRGIATELANRRQLHNSKIREMWDRHYRQLDQEIAQRGLKPGTQSYNDFVRRYIESARDEVDHVLGQFFTEYRSGIN